MILEGPINPLSIGNVSFNFARELYRRGKLNGFFPVANNFDFTAFEPCDENFKNKLIELRENSLRNLTRDQQALKCWHINESEKRLTDNQYLYTFYEVDSPTPEEIATVKMHDHVFFSSKESAGFFKEAGCENVSAVPLGFDEDFNKPMVRPREDGIVHFILIGKLEQRKNTQRIIKLWLDKYGNNSKFQLTCVINNPFFKPEFYQQIVNNTLQGKVWSNINFLPPLRTNEEVRKVHQAAHIDLSGLSNGEGWGLPAFNSTCMGRWSVVSNCSSHKDWATEENSVLVETSGKQPCYDGLFFKEGERFNQGSYYRIEDEAIIDGMERAVEKAQTYNVNGVELGERLTYSNTMDQILNEIRDSD